jgi:uncharacterized protein (TIGR00369 family)
MSELPTNASLPGLDSLLGVTIAEASGSRVVLNLSVRPNLHQPNGILHGGVHCALVESAASIGAGLWFGEKGTVVGVSNQTDFLKAVREGDLTAAAEPIHQGRLQQLWVVTITDSQNRLVARGQVRIQNLPALLV